MRESEGIPVLKDEYISSGQSGSRPGGLYLGKDENGNPKILYDDRKKAGGADKREQSKAIADSPENAEKCTTNTDRVDREIKKMKEQKQQLEQQIKAASDDEEKGKELEKKLSKTESELSQKDNDAYRRQIRDQRIWILKKDSSRTNRILHRFYINHLLDFT